jgi:cytochrome c biogenesis protein CcmG/thiol:disulfide interchange protein DsbE
VRRALAPSLVAVCAAGMLGLLVYGVAARSDSRTLDDAVAHGQRPAAPDRSLPLLRGGAQRRLADYRGQVVLVNFWASWCTPCAAEAPLLNAAQASLTRAKGTVLGVTFRDLSSDSLAFMAEHRSTYPSLRDVDGKLAESYGTTQLPETFVLDRSGRIAAISRGEVSAAFLRRAVALAERS